MSDFGDHTQGMMTPCTQDSSGAQTNNQRNAVARIESCPRLPARSDSTVATIDSDVTLRHQTGLLHASPDRHLDGRPATGGVPVVGIAHDPCPADVDENHNWKWQENDTYNDACVWSMQTQPYPAGAVATKEAGSTSPEIFPRRWKSAGPPHPELPPDMDGSDGASATNGARHVGLASDLSLRREENENERVTFETPIYGTRAEMDDGYGPDQCMVLHMGPRHDAT